MLKKIILLVAVVFVILNGSALAADKIYEVPEGACTITLPENYIVTSVERRPEPNDELEVKLSQLSVSDPADKSVNFHIMVESSKLTQELPNLDYKPGDVMKNYFIETLENGGWKEPVVMETLQNGNIYFIKFSSYIADSAGQKYDGQIYMTLKDGKILYLMIMSKERPLKQTEKALLTAIVGGLDFAKK